MSISALNFSGGVSECSLDKKPHTCPHCHKSITPRMHNSYYTGQNKLLVIFQCPDINCRDIFTGYYNFDYNGHSTKYFKLSHLSKGKIKSKEFSDNIKSVSTSFIDIYNQALKAEELGLNHICGIGYRKALEFLIKDYLINKNPDKEEAIKRTFLGPCINNYIEDPRMKSMAERAVWLGNDETHYTRRWNDKNILDLKLLLELTIHWVEMEMYTVQYEENMTR